MKILITIAITCLFVSSASLASTKKDKKCHKTQTKIEKLQKKMRSESYTTKKSRTYHDKLNKLYKQQFKYCF
ncbi:hypothetical protein C9I98_09185 [Photobacterium sanctipauli]|uniref:DUF1090 domain-containing protein n=1 Tax=Photobacterium sanctipauli TaxID=1342794 RepID=A0A2T3NVG7_9GAMM|nr:hypothetical protein C9I98_09185 [Photobacterium sanctipauli]